MDEDFQYSFNQFTVKEGLEKYGVKEKEAVIAKFVWIFKNKKAHVPVKESMQTRNQLKKVIG